MIISVRHLFVTLAFACTCLSNVLTAGSVAYTSLGAQVYLDTFNPTSGKISQRVAVAQNGTSVAVNYEPISFAFSPDGKTAYLAEQNLEAIDVATGASIWQVPLTNTIYSLATSSDGSLIYTVGYFSYLDVYLAPTGQLSKSITLPFSYSAQVLVKPDNSQIFISCNGVVILNGANYSLITHLAGISPSMALSPDGSFLYVGGTTSPDLAYVVDTSSDQITAQVTGSAGLSPGGELAITPDGKTLLIENGQGLIEASTATNTGTSFIPFSHLSSGALAADNRFAYYGGGTNVGFYQFDLTTKTVSHVASGGLLLAFADAPGGDVSMLQTLNEVLTSNPETGQVTGKLGSVLENASLALSGDGRTIVGTSGQDANVLFSLINTASHKVTQVPSVAVLGAFNPYSAINSDASMAYIVTNILSADSSVSVIDLSTGTVTSAFPLGFTFGSGWTLAISPDGSTLYVSNFGPMSSSFCSISLPANTFTLCAPFGSASADARPMAFSPDGTKVYLPALDGGLTELNAQTLAIMRSVDGAIPDGYLSNVIYSSAANAVYVATLNGSTSLIARVDLETFEITATAPLAFPPVDLAATLDGTEVLVVGGPSGTTVLDATTLAMVRRVKTGVTQGVVVATQ